MKRMTALLLLAMFSIAPDYLQHHAGRRQDVRRRERRSRCREALTHHLPAASRRRMESGLVPAFLLADAQRPILLRERGVPRMNEFAFPVSQ